MMLAQETARKITFMQRAFPLAAAVLIFVVTVELIRRRKLREEYAMLWVLASVVLLAFAIFPRLLLYLSELLGVFYLTTVVLIAFSFLSLMVLHLSVVASRSADDVRQIAQRLALLEERLERLAPPAGGAEPQGPAPPDRTASAGEAAAPES